MGINHPWDDSPLPAENAPISERTREILYGSALVTAAQGLLDAVAPTPHGEEGHAWCPACDYVDMHDEHCAWMALRDALEVASR